MKRFMALLSLIGLVALPVAVPATVSAAPIDVFQSCKKVENQICKDQSSQKLFGPGSIWTNIINTIIFLTGAVAVIMIIVGGLRYVLSGGDSASVTAAKNTILYAVIGIVIAVMAYAIVNFVITNL